MAWRCTWLLLMAACGGSHAKPDASGGSAADAAGTADAAIWPDAGPAPACAALPAPPSLPPASIASGTRLTLRTVADPATNGVVVPYGVWDSQLGTYCEPRPYHDGTIRCLPSIDSLALLPEPRFADAAATIPVALEPLAAPPAAGTLTAVTGDASGPFDCHAVTIQSFGRIGAQRSGSTYYTANGQSAAVPSGYGIFAIDTLPDDFVALQEVRTQLAGTIAVRELHGTDGSRLFARDLYDTAHDVPVAIPYGGDRLLPPRAGTPGVGMALTHLVPPNGGVVSQSWCSQRDLVFAATDASGCDVSSLHFVTDASQMTYEVVAETGKLWGCGYGEGMPYLASAMTPFLEACATIPLTDWTSATATTIGGARLTAAAYTIGSATYVPTPVPYLTDTQLGTICTPRATTDGALRCLPGDQGAIAYADAACTSPVVAASTGTPTYGYAGTQPSFAFPDLRGTITVYAVGAPRAASTVYYRTPEGCTALTGWSSWNAGAVVAPAAFAALELRDVP